jgi:hypothetical protein
VLLPARYYYFGAAGTALLLVTFAGLVARRRHRLSWAFAAYLLLIAAADTAVMLWPERYYRHAFWTAKEAVLAALRMLIVMEVGGLVFQALRGARAQLVVLLASVAGFSAVALNLIPLEGEPYFEWLGRLAPLSSLATLWLLCCLAGLASYYSVPLHPFHRDVLLGLALYLMTSGSTFALLGELGAQAYPLIEPWAPAASMASVSVWAWAAWRRLSAPEPVWVARRLQPWASW